MTENAPVLILSAVHDAKARTAALTRCHGDAIEKAMNAAGTHSIAGFEFSELGIHTKAFAALRKNLKLDQDTVAIYDVFALSSKLDETTRKAAAQFLTAEALWALEEQGLLNGAPTHEKLDLPKDWDKDPAKIRDKLVELGAHELGDEAVQTYMAIKQAWDASSSS